MKIIYLLILSMILLSSFTVATVEIVQLPKPEITLSLVEGGTLNEGVTYYFIGFFNGNAYTPYYGQFQSPVSEMINITTNSTHKSINIYWGNLHSESKGIVFKWDNNTLINETTGEMFRWTSLSSGEQGVTSECDRGHRRWTHQYNQNGFTGNNKTLTSSDLHDGYIEGLTYYCSFFQNPEIAWDECDKPTYYNSNVFNVSKGKIGIKITGTADFDDIITELMNNNSNEGTYLYNGFIPSGKTGAVTGDRKGSLTLMGQLYGDGSLEVDGSIISFLSGDNDIVKANFSNSVINVLNRHMWTNNYGDYDNVLLLTNALFLGLDNVNKATGLIPFGNYVIATNYKGSDGFNFYNNNHQLRYTRDYYNYTNLLYSNGYPYITPLYGQPYYWNTSFQLKNFTINNYNKIDYDIYYTLTYADNYNGNWYYYNFTNVKVDRPDGIARIRYSTIADNNVTINTSVNSVTKLTLKNKNGEFIDGNVTVTDVTGRKYFQETTNSVSKINTEVYRIDYNESDTSECSVCNSHTYLMQPFNITIQSEGYIQTTGFYNFTESIDWTITMTNSSDCESGNSGCDNTFHAIILDNSATKVYTGG